MNFTMSTYSNDMEILYSNANLVPFSGTVLQSNVTEADEHGKKYVPAGSLIDADGNVVIQTGTTGAETLSSTPAGILLQTIDVTNGDQPGALIVEGYVRADRVINSFADAAIALIKAALPKVTFR